MVSTSVASADEYKITQITDNDYPDAGVEMYNSKLVWQAEPLDSPEPEIFYYDGKKTIQLTNDGDYKCTPSISSGGIAWQAYRPNGGSDVFFYDFNNIRRLTDDAKDDFRVAICGNNVVWCKEMKLDGQIMLYNGKDITAINGAYTVFPRISSSGIMYSNIFDGHIYFYDWNEIINLGNVSIECGYNAHNQQINEDKLAWRRHINGYHEVFLYDILTGVITQITKGETNSKESGWTCHPSVSGNYIAWRNKKNDVDYLRLYDGGQVSTITSAHEMSNPYFGDGFLVWSMRDNDESIKLSKGMKIFTGMEIFIYDLDSKETIQITNDNHADYHPVASGKYIGWQKYDGNDYEIYLAQIME